MPNLIRCNICELPRACKMIDRIEDSSECSSFLGPIPYKVPILMHLLTDKSKISKAHRVLSKYRFRVIELKEYPYFKLAIVK